MLDSFTKSEHFKPLVIRAFILGGLCAIALGGVAMDVSVTMWGFFIGALGGAATYFGRTGLRRSPERPYTEPADPDPILELAGNRYAIRTVGFLFLLPTAGFWISHEITGVGAYGFVVGILAVAIPAFLLGRFRGPAAGRNDDGSGRA